jgi:NADPH:quinone reductase-like Zn-dependent oxidoreductase
MQAFALQKEVLRLTGGKGVDIVYDPVVSYDGCNTLGRLCDFC